LEVIGQTFAYMSGYLQWATAIRVVPSWGMAMGYASTHLRVSMYGLVPLKLAEKKWFVRREMCSPPKTQV
jgi:hypothetical protein